MSIFVLKRVLIGSCIFFHTLQLFGQDSDLNVLHDWYDEKTNLSSSSLYSGVQYVNEYVVYGDSLHQFYNLNRFEKGNVLFDDKHFSSVFLKYDLYNDDLILAPSGSAGSFPFKLSKSNVGSFELNGTKFYNVNKFKNVSESQKFGFCQFIWGKKGFELYRKFWKTKKEVTVRNRRFYEFTEKERFFVFLNEKLYPADDKTDWITIFPEHKEEIRLFFRNSRKQINTNASKFYERLSNHMNVILNEEKQTNA